MESFKIICISGYASGLFLTFNHSRDPLEVEFTPEDVCASFKTYVAFCHRFKNTYDTAKAYGLWDEHFTRPITTQLFISGHDHAFLTFRFPQLHLSNPLGITVGEVMSALCNPLQSICRFFREAFDAQIERRWHIYNGGTPMDSTEWWSKRLKFNSITKQDFQEFKDLYVVMGDLWDQNWSRWI
jgi:hypothetical protein